MSEQIPLFKVFMHEDDSLLRRTLHSGYVAQGNRVDEFERMLRSYLNADNILTVNSGTSAIDLAFALVGITAGDYVISTPMTCVATNIMLAHRGAKILWADVDPVTGLISPESIKRLLKKHAAKAIVAVDWGGKPCDYDAIRDARWSVSRIPIIEDAAHAFGADYKNKPMTFHGGDYVAWSFQAIKHLTTGDGGALFVADPLEFQRAKRLRWFGYDRDAPGDFRVNQDLPELGFKYHMNDLAASIGISNLPTVRSMVLFRHRNNALSLHEKLSGNVPDGVLPEINSQSSWWVYTIRCKKRDALIGHLKSLGIQSSPVHRRNDEYAGLKKVSMWKVPHPALDEFASTELAVPVGWWLSREAIDRIVDALKTFAW